MTYKTKITERMDGLPILNKAAAIRKARGEVQIYSQGRDWIISQYDYVARAWRESHAMDWCQAREARRHRWTARAYEYMGWDADDAEFLADEKPL